MEEQEKKQKLKPGKQAIGKKREPDMSRSRPNGKFAQMQHDPEGRRLWALWTVKKLVSQHGRTRGSMDGYNKVALQKLKKIAHAEAQVIVEYLIGTGQVSEEINKNQYAKEAFEAAVEVMRLDALAPKDKLAAARTVLEWTMAKPVAQSEVTVKSAESFLDAIADDLAFKHTNSDWCSKEWSEEKGKYVFKEESPLDKNDV